MKKRNFVYLFLVATLLMACNKQNEILVQSPNGQKADKFKNPSLAIA